MGLEIEAKMRIADLAAIRSKLQAVGATHIGHTNEINRFFDAPDGRLRNKGHGLRLRTNTNAQTGDASHVVTMKGPLQAGPFKSREELEFSVDDVEAAKTVFERLGYSLELSFEKRRESWTLDGCKIELDEMPIFGTFVEIEGPDEASVIAARRTLGLHGEPNINQGYASMVAQHLSGTNLRELKF
jgi:adenylate cyclase class 2